MAGKRFSAEQIIIKLREAEVGLAQGQTVGQVCKLRWPRLVGQLGGLFKVYSDCHSYRQNLLG